MPIHVRTRSHTHEVILKISRDFNRVRVSHMFGPTRLSQRQWNLNFIVVNNFLSWFFTSFLDSTSCRGRGKVDVIKRLQATWIALNVITYERLSYSKNRSFMEKHLEFKKKHFVLWEMNATDSETHDLSFSLPRRSK